MPIYEYECKKCGKIQEVFQKFSDKPLTRCIRCSGKLHKLISHSSFHLKGTGWYVTDYAKGSRPNSAATKKQTRTKQQTAQNQRLKIRHLKHPRTNPHPSLIPLAIIPVQTLPSKSQSGRMNFT